MVRNQVGLESALTWIGLEADGIARGMASSTMKMEGASSMYTGASVPEPLLELQDIEAAIGYGEAQVRGLLSVRRTEHLSPPRIRTHSSLFPDHLKISLSGQTGHSAYTTL